MTRLKKILAMMACALIACVVIAGCGAKDYKKDFIGTWEICEMETSGEVTTEDDLSLLKSFGLHVYLDITEEGFTLDLFGEKTEGTWEATAEKTATATIDGSEANMTINEDGQLQLEQNGSILRFKQIDPAEKEEGSTSTSDLLGTDDGATTDEAPAEDGATEEAPAEVGATEGEEAEADAA